jgi:hypothetical protein
MKLVYLAFFSLLGVGCYTNTPQKLPEGQTQARLRKYQNLRGWNIRADGDWQFYVHRNCYGVSRNLPFDIHIYGHVVQKTGEKWSCIDAGRLYIGSARSRISPPPDTINGAHYQIDTSYNADIFGKTVHYKLQKGDEKPVFEGDTYIGDRIAFPHINPKGLPYINRKNGRIKWTPDPKYKNDIGVEITFENNKTGQRRGDVFTTKDNGLLYFKDFVRPADSIYTQMDIVLSRTNCIVKKGRDGKKYKITVYSHCEGLFVFE